ncbi:ABC transporter substrate-binding protein [Solidesulfovibrio sp.]|uniref:ABC transporter substrate-binding protein n=1 Tax=Solidesulfovibrio sp. TaxID=2910990 RepID=UPI00260CA96B|nr:ABC transporter substrate-binding protein [Solidesulfovibrio sp.]
MLCRLRTRFPLPAFCLALLFAFTAATAFAQADKVTIGYSKLIISLPVFVAADQGLFAQNGLDATLEEFETAQPLMDALVSGKIDVAGYTAYAITMNASLRAKKDLYYLTSLVEDAKHPISKLLVKKDSPVGSIAELKGKRVGILPTIAYKLWMEAILAENGVDPADVTLQNVAPPLSASALESGTVDALFTNDPAAAAVLKSGLGRELVTGAVVPEFLGSPFPFASFNIAKAYADAHPAVVAKIVKSLDEAIARIDADPAKAKRSMEKFVKDTEKPFVPFYSDPFYLPSAQFSGADLEAVMERYLALKMIPAKLELKDMALSAKK